MGVLSSPGVLWTISFATQIDNGFLMDTLAIQLIIGETSLIYKS